MFPIVRVLALRSFAATTVRVSPPGQDLPVLLRLPLRLDEVPPADVLPLAVAALVGAREEDHHALDEERELVRRDPAAGQLLPQEPPPAVRGPPLVRVG